MGIDTTIEIWLVVVNSLLVPFAVYVVRNLIMASKRETEIDEKIKVIVRDHETLKIDSNEKIKKIEVEFKEKIDRIEDDNKEQLRAKDDLLKQNQELSKEIIRLQVQIQHYEKRFDALETLLKDLIKAIKLD